MMDDQNQQQAVQSFVNHMLKYTLRLVTLDERGKPLSGIAGGFMIEAGRDLRVVSAGHVLGRIEPWVIEVAQASSTETLCFSISKIQVGGRVARLPSGETIDVDLAWGAIDREAIYRQLSADGRMDPAQIDLPFYSGPLDAEPSTQEAYGFASWSRVEFLEDKRTLIREAAYECCMQFAGRDRATNLYTFRLAREHQGHGYYRGASGSPIADSTGKIVSIVTGGNEAENVIYGAALSAYSRIFDSESHAAGY